MRRDNFEEFISKRLKQNAAPVPSDAWQNIQKQLHPTIGAAPSLTSAWVFSAAGAILILVGLSWYSDVKYNSTVQNNSQSGSAHKIIQIQTPAQEPVKENSSIVLKHVGAPEKASSEEYQKQQIIPTAVNIEVKANWSVDDLFPAAAEIKPTLPVSVESEPKPEKLRNSPELRNAIKDLRPQQHLANSVDTEPAKILTQKTEGFAPFQLSVSASNSAKDYKWETSNGKVSYKKNAEFIFDEPGYYTVYLSTTDKTGAISNDMIEVEVVEDSKLFVPNSFTPNDDGVNDIFKVEASLIDEFVMQIRNVEGTVLFNTNNIAQGWDPDLHELKSQTREPHVFIVSIVAKDIYGKTHTINKKLNVIY